MKEKAENTKFVELFNKVQESLKCEIEEETPGFRLYENIDTSEIDTNSLEVAKFLFSKLLQKGYRVEVVEDLDILNVTNDERYTIRIRNVNSNVEYRIGLYNFREKLLNYDFEPDAFIIEVLKRIEGSKGNTELKEFKDDILNYLSYAIHYKELFRYEYSTIGWDRATFDNKTRIFKYDNIISNNVDIKGLIKEKYKGLYTPSANIFSTDHKEEDWKQFTIQLMNSHTYDSLFFAIGISGLIRQILTFTKETNLNINIMGESGSGKSTIGHYILSFFGNPTLLEGTSIDTENASEKIRAERPVLPYVLDERMLRFYGDSENKKKTELLLEVFREYEGKEKERLGKQYENSAGQRIYGPVISSSVQSMLTILRQSDDLGQYRRFAEFNVGKAEDEILFNVNEAVQAEEIANSCYGYGIRYIVEYMLYQFEQDDRYFENQFKLITTDIKERLTHAQNTNKLNGLTSSSMRIALIVLSYKVLRESFIYKEQGKINDSIIQSEALLSDKTEEIISELIRNLVEKMNSVKDNKKRSLRDYLISIYSSNIAGVSKDYDSWNVKEGELINISKTSDCIIVSFIRGLHLERILLNKDLPSIEEVLNIAKRINTGEKWQTIYEHLGAITDSKVIPKIVEENKFEIDNTTKDGIKVTRISVPLVLISDSKEEEETNE